MQREPVQFSRTREVSAFQLRRSLYLFKGDLRARIEPDCSSSWVHSSRAGRVLFGREAAEVFRLQAGVRIAVRPQDVMLRATPDSASFSHRGQERVLVAQSVRLLRGESEGWARSVVVTNRGDSPSRLRVITLHDPTSLNFRRERDPPGEIGVNAFNRNDQVVMDDVGDTTGVRIIAFSPRPSAIYMTKDRSRALELLALGELPESSLGMSGSVILLAQHDLELPSGATAELRTVSLYHPSSLESALSAAAQPDAPEREEGPEFSSSNPSINFTFDWAKAALFAMESEPDASEKLWSGVGLGIARDGYLERMLESLRDDFRKDGTLPHMGNRSSRHGDRPGSVETSLYVIGACSYLLRHSKDKKVVRKWYPRVRKAAAGLAATLRDGLVQSPGDSPDGWRRHLEAGFPSGWTSEVNLIALRAFEDASAAAALAGKIEDAAKFGDVGGKLAQSINGRLRDPETGGLLLNVDSRGIAHREVTVDQAVGLSYCPLDRSLSSSVVRRLMENDFDTGFGPRTVPTSNNLYYSTTYADGQLGGYWTRAAVAHAMLAYLSGQPATGSAQLEKVARLVHLEAERNGGVPGEIPYWIDTEKKQVKWTGTDPVAAARFIEAVVRGEAGLSLTTGGARLSVPEASLINWFFLHGLQLSGRGTIFVGRSAGRAYVASDLEDLFDPPGARGSHAPMLYPECARLATKGGVEALAFWDQASTLVCVGNPGGSPLAGALAVPLRSKSFSRALFARMDELQQDSGAWTPLDKVKLVSQLELKVELKPWAWKVLRLSGVA